MNFKLLIFIILISFFSCKKDEMPPIDNLNGGIIYVIGHGGAGFQSAFNKAPENSLSGIIKAVDVYYVDGVEVDVQLSKNLNLVLYHDNKLETSTNGNGFIYEYDLNELIQFKYDRGFYANILLDEYIISLETVLQNFSQRKVKPQLHLDLRSSLYNSSIYNSTEFHSVYIDKIATLINQYQYQDHTYIGSDNVDLLIDLHQKNSQIKLLIETNNVNSAVEKAVEKGWYGVIASNQNISKSNIEYAHSKNVGIAIFGVKIQSSIEDAISKHPDFIITDNILKLQQILYY